MGIGESIPIPDSNIDSAKVKKRRTFNHRLRIQNFERAMLPQPACEHLHVRYWSEKYNHGMKCKACGKELMNSHHDPDQLNGVGIRPEEPMNAEEYWLRMHKEKGEMELEEETFYDY